MKETFSEISFRTFVVAMVAWGLPSVAFADCPTDADCRQAGLELHWLAGPECPDEAHLFADVERLSHRHVETVGRPQLAVSGGANLRDGTWVVELQVSEDGAPPNLRRVEGKTCREVSDAAAVVIALALDAPAERSDVKVVVPPKPPPPKSPTRRPTPRPRSPERDRPGFRFALLGGFDAVAMPGIAFGGGLTGGVTYASNRFEGRVLLFAPRDEQMGAKSGGSVALYAGAVRYCRVFVDKPVWDLAGCGGFEAGALDAHGFGFVKNESGLGRWLAPELSIGAAGHPFKGFGVGLELAGLVPLVRDEFRVDSTLAYRTAPVDARLLISISYGGP